MTSEPRSFPGLSWCCWYSRNYSRGFHSSWRKTKQSKLLGITLTRDHDKVEVSSTTIVAILVVPKELCGMKLQMESSIEKRRWEMPEEHLLLMVNRYIHSIARGYRNWRWQGAGWENSLFVGHSTYFCDLEISLGYTLASTERNQSIPHGVPSFKTPVVCTTREWMASLTWLYPQPCLSLANEPTFLNVAGELAGHCKSLKMITDISPAKLPYYLTANIHRSNSGAVGGVTYGEGYRMQIGYEDDFFPCNPDPDVKAR